jgi:hypothetical protein
LTPTPTPNIIRRMNSKETSTETFVRISSRIRRDQDKQAKDLAKKKNISVGAMHREIFDYYFKNNK